MKKNLLVICMLVVANNILAQTNTFPSSGNVGIGVTAPSYKLDILGGDATSSVRTQLKHASSNIFLQQYAGNTDAAIITGNNPFHFQNDGGICYTIKENGFIGIGTTAPSYKLDILGGDATSSVRTQLKHANSNIFLQQYVDNAEAEIVTSNNPLHFENNGGIRMTILANGYIGMGTTTPSEKLAVNGNISAKKMIVTQLGWSDYVFDKPYKLLSLSSLETFIKQNKHLPEVPSALEVEERKGISVGDNQALLLMKIEELTLYVIDLKKENMKQQAQINKLTKTRK